MSVAIDGVPGAIGTKYIATVGAEDTYNNLQTSQAEFIISNVNGVCCNGGLMSIHSGMVGAEELCEGIGGVFNWIGPLDKEYTDSTWKNIEFSYVNNGTCGYKVDSDSMTYSIGTAYSSKTIFIAFDHRAPSATVTQKVDWIAARAYTSSEPPVTPGAEVGL